MRNIRLKTSFSSSFPNFNHFAEFDVIFMKFETMYIHAYFDRYDQFFVVRTIYIIYHAQYLSENFTFFNIS